MKYANKFKCKLITTAELVDYWVRQTQCSNLMFKWLCKLLIPQFHLGSHYLKK